MKKKGYINSNINQKKTCKFCLIIYRVQYLEKSKHLQNQLRDLKTEIEVLKVDEKQSELDMLHDEQVRLGENKYSTLKKVNIYFVLTYLIFKKK